VNPFQSQKVNRFYWLSRTLRCVTTFSTTTREWQQHCLILCFVLVVLRICATTDFSEMDHKICYFLGRLTTNLCYYCSPCSPSRNEILSTPLVLRMSVRGWGAVDADRGRGVEQEAGPFPRGKSFWPQNDKSGCTLTQYGTDRKHGQSLEALWDGFYGSIAKRSLQKQCTNYTKNHGQTKARGGGFRLHHHLGIGINLFTHWMQLVVRLVTFCIHNFCDIFCYVWYP